MTHNQKPILEIKELLTLTDSALTSLNVEIIQRIRTRLEVFILEFYGKDSVFYRNFLRIGKWESVFNLREIRGLLMALKDNVQNNPKFSLLPDSDGRANQNHTINDRLSYLLLREFHENSQYNWEAIKNLILYNSDFFDYSEEEAAMIFEKFKERRIIAEIGIGHAHIITEEGRKMYQRLSDRWGGDGVRAEKLLTPQKREMNNWDVFLCHSSKDKDLIYKIAADFKRRDISYWLDAEQISPGDNIFNKITEGLTGSRIIVPCLSENQLASGWCRNEYQAILGQILSNVSAQRIAPLALNDFGSANIPLFLSNYRYERYFVNEEYEKFLSFLESKSRCRNISV